MFLTYSIFLLPPKSKFITQFPFLASALDTLVTKSACRVLNKPCYTITDLFYC